ncbi:hypothetical protein AB0D34_08180 [Streptomyces sp. NPDC048420]|uniref:hypothetical protein n=1 Tax=Streptomyces sp. NPDC048420 TaxID=3155755 RepID=UPI003423DE1D
MKTADVWTGYIGYTGAARSRFASWSSGVLGKVTSYVTEEGIRYTPNGHYRMRHVTVRTPDGSTWRGPRRHRHGREHDPTSGQEGFRRRQRSEGSP